MRAEWEDMEIYLTEEEAIDISTTFPNERVEIFVKVDNKYIPSYCYYQNGILISNH